MALCPPSAPTTQPTRVVRSPSGPRRVTSTPSPSWDSPVSETPRSTTIPSSVARSARTASVSGWGMSSRKGWRLGTSSNGTRARVSPVRPSTMAIAGMRRPRASSRGSTPIAASISMLRAWRVTARDSVVGAGRASTTRTGTPSRASWEAVVSPTGPAPTTSTPCVVLMSRVLRALVW